MEVASGSAGAQVQSAYDAYENFKQGLDAGLNASLIGAQSQVDTAYDAYVRAQNAYDRYKENVSWEKIRRFCPLKRSATVQPRRLTKRRMQRAAQKKPIMH